MHNITLCNIEASKFLPFEIAFYYLYLEIYNIVIVKFRDKFTFYQLTMTAMLSFIYGLINNIQ